MKVIIYLKIAKGRKGRVLIKSSTKPDYSPIETVKYGSKHGDSYPTVAFAINVDIPDESFRRAEKVVAELNLKEEEVKINSIEASI